MLIVQLLDNVAWSANRDIRAEFEAEKTKAKREGHPYNRLYRHGLMMNCRALAGPAQCFSDLATWQLAAKRKGERQAEGDIRLTCVMMN